MTPQVLVAGIGNIFLGDDGFGSEVARALAAEAVPAGTRVVDYGIRGMHLAFDLLEGFDALVIIDTVPRQEAPGTLRVLEVVADDLGEGELDAHGMQPTAVLASLGGLGGRLPRTIVVGCEPQSVAEGIGLSEPVAAAVPAAVSTVLSLLTHELAVEPPDRAGTPATHESPRAAGKEH
ncbi:MAG: hydrogenase maturation protease [Actinomycetes bacterium]